MTNREKTSPEKETQMQKAETLQKAPAKAQRAANTDSKKKASEDVSGVFCYVGPTIPGVIQENSIYTGSRAEIEGSLETAISDFPDIKTMLVQAEALARIRQGIKSKHKNSFSVTYSELLRQAQEKRRKEVESDE